ncbi:DUF1566 domain-containing protein [bacterium]|nr:DUF1566 domain-containing protein [bacterium]
MEKIFIDHGDYIELIEPIGGIKMITKIAGKMSWNAAEASSKKSRIGNFSDWRLPTKEELKHLYQIREVCIGLGLYDTFWSSSAENCRPDCKWVVGFIEKEDEGPSCVDFEHYVFFVR